MRYYHEFGEGWSPKDGMVCRLEIHYLERDVLGPKVFLSAECDGRKLIYPSDIAEVPGITPWNGELLRLISEHEIFMSPRVLAKRMLSPLPPSTRTLLSLTVRTIGSSTRG